MKREELEEAIHEEWRAMHHNASIAGHWPELQNEYEAELFIECLGDYASDCIDELHERIKEEFGKSLTFYQYGRQGATIAPDEYMNAAPCNNFGSCNYYMPAGIEGYNEGRRVLSLFRFINKYWNDCAKHVPEWWREMKDANGYDEQIKEHENMHAVMRRVWVANS